MIYPAMSASHRVTEESLLYYKVLETKSCTTAAVFCKIYLFPKMNFAHKISILSAESIISFVLLVFKLYPDKITGQKVTIH
jgi:hypothetical protein